jgi:hypothetical protein
MTSPQIGCGARTMRITRRGVARIKRTKTLRMEEGERVVTRRGIRRLRIRTTQAAVKVTRRGRRIELQRIRTSNDIFFTQFIH